MHPFAPAHPPRLPSPTAGLRLAMHVIDRLKARKQPHTCMSFLHSRDTNAHAVRPMASSTPASLRSARAHAMASLSGFLPAARRAACASAASAAFLKCFLAEATPAEGVHAQSGCLGHACRAFTSASTKRLRGKLLHCSLISILHNSWLYVIAPTTCTRMHPSVATPEAVHTHIFRRSRWLSPHPPSRSRLTPATTGPLRAGHRCPA